MQIIKFKRIALGFTMMFSSISLMANTYHVSNSGNDANNGFSAGKAFKTIQKATDIVIAGDSVWVYDGYYKGFNHKNKNSGNSANPIVYLAKGVDVIINDGSNIGDGINVEGNDWIEINGFKVFRIPDNTGIAGAEEGIRAVYANHITISNCQVDSCYRGILTGYTDYILIEKNICTRSYGEHGIYVSNNSDYITLRFNSCSFNKATGIQINPDLSSGAPGYSTHIICTNNVVFENKGAAGFNFQGIDSALIANNLIYNNHNASGITLFHGDASKGCTNINVYNNTIIVPNDGRWGIHIIDDASNIRIHNNIIINLHSWKGSIALQAGSFTQSNITSNYNLVSNKFCDIDDGCTKTLTQWQVLGYDLNSILASTSLGSLFKNYINGDYHILPGSVAIDKGTSLVSGFVATDFEMNSRPQGSAYDIGCYEYKTTGMNDNVRNNDLIDISPNPVKQNDNFTIWINKSDAESLNIYDCQGKLLLQMIKPENSTILNTNQFPKGMYLIEILDKEGGRQIKKILIN